MRVQTEVVSLLSCAGFVLPSDHMRSNPVGQGQTPAATTSGPRWVCIICRWLALFPGQCCLARYERNGALAQAALKATV